VYVIILCIEKKREREREREREERDSKTERGVCNSLL